MTTIKLETLIEAPIDVCFQLSLSIDLELKAAKAHQIRAVSGVTSGMIGAGQRVGWKTRQFGITVSHESEITAFDRPSHFRDSMVAGIFRSFQHDHFFESPGKCKTLMRDVLRFAMPIWLLGSFSERLVIQRRLTQLLKLRNTMIKEAAELAGSQGSPDISESPQRSSGLGQPRGSLWRS